LNIKKYKQELMTIIYYLILFPYGVAQELGETPLR
jgi:hypothetical protein